MEQQKKEEKRWAGVFFARQGFYATNDLLDAAKGITEEKPDCVIGIDPFTKDSAYDRNRIIGYLQSIHSCDWIIFQDRSSVPQDVTDVRFLKDPGELKQLAMNYRRVLAIVPHTLHSYLRFLALVNCHQHHAYDEYGILHSDASWVIDEQNRKGGNFEATMINATAYAMPYPDATGDGSKVLEGYRAAETGMDYFVDCDYAEERIEQAAQLADCPYRCKQNSITGEIEVNTRNFAWYHTGTLIAKIKAKWPDARRVIITGNSGPIYKKTHETQVSVALCEPDFGFHGLIQKLAKKEKVNLQIVSPMFYHMGRDEYDAIREMRVQAQRQAD